MERINELLNRKEVRCLGCERLIRFADRKELGFKPVITNLSHYECVCGETNDLNGLAYISYKEPKSKELMEMLDEFGLLNIEGKSDKDIENKLSELDKIARDR